MASYATQYLRSIGRLPPEEEDEALNMVPPAAALEQAPVDTPVAEPAPEPEAPPRYDPLPASRAQTSREMDAELSGLAGDYDEANRRQRRIGIAQAVLGALGPTRKIAAGLSPLAQAAQSKADRARSKLYAQRTLRNDLEAFENRDRREAIEDQKTRLEADKLDPGSEYNRRFREMVGKTLPGLDVPDTAIAGDFPAYQNLWTRQWQAEQQQMRQDAMMDLARERGRQRRATAAVKGTRRGGGTGTSDMAARQRQVVAQSLVDAGKSSDEAQTIVSALGRKELAKAASNVAKRAGKTTKPQQARAIPAQMVEKIADTRARKMEFGDAYSTLDGLDATTNFGDGIGGKASQALNEWVSSVGLESKEYRDYAAAMSGIATTARNRISGAAVSEQEEKNLMPLVPKVTDTPAQAKVKLRTLEKQLDNLEKARLDTLKRAGYDVSGFEDKQGTVTPKAAPQAAPQAGKVTVKLPDGRVFRMSKQKADIAVQRGAEVVGG